MHEVIPYVDMSLVAGQQWTLGQMIDGFSAYASRSSKFVVTISGQGVFTGRLNDQSLPKKPRHLSRDLGICLSAIDKRSVKAFRWMNGKTECCQINESGQVVLAILTVDEISKPYYLLPATPGDFVALLSSLVNEVATSIWQTQSALDYSNEIKLLVRASD